MGINKSFKHLNEKTIARRCFYMGTQKLPVWLPDNWRIDDKFLNHKGFSSRESTHLNLLKSAENRCKALIVMVDYQILNLRKCCFHPFQSCEVLSLD